MGTAFGAAGGGIERGTIYSLTPPISDRGTWRETLIYRFGVHQQDLSDGLGPTGVAIGPDGALYGSTRGGSMTGVAGTSNGNIFKLSFDEAKSTWTETVLYTFPTSGPNSSVAHPSSPVILDADGAIYGTAEAGVVFKLLQPVTGSTQWTLSIIHDFGPYSIVGALLIDQAGNLYGTERGGVHPEGSVFELSP